MSGASRKVRKSPIRPPGAPAERQGLVVNAAGRDLLLGSMVLDRARCCRSILGDSIIPQQALNCDATVMFEFTVSRQSFIFTSSRRRAAQRPGDGRSRTSSCRAATAARRPRSRRSRHTRWRPTKMSRFPACCLCFVFNGCAAFNAGSVTWVLQSGRGEAEASYAPPPPSGSLVESSASLSHPRGCESLSCACTAD